MARFTAVRNPLRAVTLGMVAALSLASAPAQAASFDLKDVTYSIEPIVGYELSRKSDPTPHAKLVLIYGARLVAGWKIVAAEGEYTRGNSREEYLDRSLTLEDLSEKAKLGLRSRYDVTPGIGLSVRAGGEASRTTSKSTVAGVLTETQSPVKVAPYVGGGLAVALGSKFSLTAEGTVTLKDLNDLSQAEYQGTFGLKLSLGSTR